MASFVTTNNKTKVIVRKKGYPTRCKTFLKKSDGIIWARKVESEIVSLGNLVSFCLLRYNKAITIH